MWDLPFEDHKLYIYWAWIILIVFIKCTKFEVYTHITFSLIDWSNYSYSEIQIIIQKTYQNDVRSIREDIHPGKKRHRNERKESQTIVWRRKKEKSRRSWTREDQLYEDKSFSHSVQHKTKKKLTSKIKLKLQFFVTSL